MSFLKTVGNTVKIAIAIPVGLAVTIIGIGVLGAIISGGNSSDVDTTISTSKENKVVTAVEEESNSESPAPTKTKYQLAQELKSAAESIQLPESSGIASADAGHKITLLAIDRVLNTEGSERKLTCEAWKILRSSSRFGESRVKTTADIENIEKLDKAKEVCRITF